MDHNRDNPLKRFSAFWIALLLVGCFGIACVILRPMTHGDVDTAYEKVSAKRLATKLQIESAQSSAVNEEKLSKAAAATAKSLNSAPTPGAMPLLPAATTK